MQESGGGGAAEVQDVTPFVSGDGVIFSLGHIISWEVVKNTDHSLGPTLETYSENWMSLKF